MGARILDLFVGLVLGGLVTTAGSYWLLGRSLVRLEEQVAALRRDVDRMMEG